MASNYTNNKNKAEPKSKNNMYMLVPYTKGLIESVKNICNKHGIHVYFQGHRINQEPPGGLAADIPSHRGVE